ILAEDGTEMVKYEYDAYGNIINSPTGILSNINPYTYRGYRYDSEIGMYYLNSRYYNPQSGFFISSDGTIGQIGDIISTNMYAYCQNNPVMFVDNEGNFGTPAILTLALFSAIVNAMAQIISNFIAGRRGTQIFDGVLGSALGGAVNSTLLLTLWYVPGNNIIAAFAGGAVTAIINLLEDVIIWKTATPKDFVLDFILGSAANLAGNFLGAKAIKVGSTWFQPKYFSAIFLKPFGQRLLAQTGIAAALNGIINYIRSKLEDVFGK
ncbi:MAG: RHS repeat-associated core domain-containing protein, partial [Candidatus Izemoplasmatales bacterium]|nr:RHS repeat-associated core domain-containing protein [Candidatus Izemoplasmatales bacterium]